MISSLCRTRLIVFPAGVYTSPAFGPTISVGCGPVLRRSEYVAWFGRLRHETIDQVRDRGGGSDGVGTDRCGRIHREEAGSDREAVRPAQQMVIQASGARRIERRHHRGDVRLGPGSCLFEPAGLKHTTAAGDDAECLLI